MAQRDFKFPDTEIAKIADAGMLVIESLVKEAGGEVEQVFVLLTTKGLEPDACTCGHGFEDQMELIAYLLSHASQAAKASGLDLRILPMNMG